MTVSKHVGVLIVGAGISGDDGLTFTRNDAAVRA
jgi:hypothetical protein